MASLTQLFTLELCEDSALLNAHMSLSFPLDSQANWICYKLALTQVKIHKLPRKKVKQI